jgi:hypothetical protein
MVDTWLTHGLPYLNGLPYLKDTLGAEDAKLTGAHYSILTVSGYSICLNVETS